MILKNANLEKVGIFIFGDLFQSEITQKISF